MGIGAIYVRIESCRELRELHRLVELLLPRHVLPLISLYKVHRITRCRPDLHLPFTIGPPQKVIFKTIQARDSLGDDDLNPGWWSSIAYLLAWNFLRAKEMDYEVIALLLFLVSAHIMSI